MERPLKVGFIGCGEVGAEKHLPAVREVRELDVVAVADVDPERLRSVEARYGIPRLHRDAASLLAERELDVVAVCLPPRLQVAAAVAALEADKHVWIEAPVGLSLPDCDRLIAKARASYATGNQRLFAGDPAGAIRAYRESLNDYSGYVAAYRGLGLAYTQQGEKTRALQAFRTYVGLVPNARDVELIKKRIASLQIP